MQSEAVTIGVCTCLRPQLLQKCLESLSALAVPPDVTLSLVVVDNEPEANNEKYVTAFAQGCSFPVHYVHAPRRGIAVARNAILDKAQVLGAGWIAMLDDDETADPEWIAGLMAAEYRQAPVLRGRRIFIYPGGKPFWLRRKERKPPAEGAFRLRRKERKPPAEGAAVMRVSTFNVRFSADLIKAGLRFDEALGLCGGEDRRFFDQAAEAGFPARITNRAITYEAVHAERMTYRYQLARRYTEIAGISLHEIKSEGRTVVLARIPRLMADIPLGMLEIAVSPLAALFGADWFRSFALRGGHRLAYVAGNFSALFGRLPQHYQQVAGN